jgi:tetratricopeptide (TPR) repeat protein
VHCHSVISNLQRQATRRVGKKVRVERARDKTAQARRFIAEDPDYSVPYRLRQNVLTYLGRAHYETGRDKDARATLEKALSRDNDDYMARLYLGLTLLRDSKVFTIR